MSHAPHMAWRVLLVEDDPIIAIMLGDMLRELGCSIVGPAGGAAAALTIIASQPIDGAVLDWNLGREDSSAVADELLRRSTPFVFSTGHGTTGVAERFVESRCWQNPTVSIHSIAFSCHFLGVSNVAPRPQRGP